MMQDVFQKLDARVQENDIKVELTISYLMV